MFKLWRIGLTSYSLFLLWLFWRKTGFEGQNSLNVQKKSDPRHQKRIAIVKNLFSYQFHKKQKFGQDTKEVISNLPQIDKFISAYAPEWPPDQIPPMDLAILRLGIFELLYQKETPYKVAVDEAVELAKEFGSDKSFEFINGVLGTIIEKELKIKD